MGDLKHDCPKLAEKVAGIWHELNGTERDQIRAISPQLSVALDDLLEAVVR